MAKTLEEHLDVAEDRYSRKMHGHNVDSLYPILLIIVKEGVKTWLEERKAETHIDEDVDEFVFNMLIEELTDWE